MEINKSTSIEVSKDNSTVVLNDVMLVESKPGEYTNTLAFMCKDAIIKMEYMLRDVDKMEYRLKPPEDVLSAFTIKMINKKLRIVIEEDMEEEKLFPATTCMSDEEFKRISEAATDALTDIELKGYDIECGLRGVKNIHLRNSKIE